MGEYTILERGETRVPEKIICRKRRGMQKKRHATWEEVPYAGLDPLAQALKDTGFKLKGDTS